jgi:4-amino-4-deoxy-L-arabinose transferase-like glycosyltransferase
MKRIFSSDFPIITFIIFISVILFFFRLGNTALTNWDEAWFGSVAQDMAKSGSILAGKWNGQIFFYEPPLLVWLLTLTIRIFGESEFWLRSVSAISGVFTVIGCYVLAKKIAKSRLAGLLTSLIILSDIEILFRSRQINVEILLTVLLLWSVIFMVKADEENKYRWIISSAICLSLAFLTKRASPLLAVPAIGYLLLKTKPVLRNFFIFFITFIIFTLPWYLLSYLKWGGQFINEFFIGYTLNKIKSVNASIGTSPFFYLNSIKHAFKFWTLLIPLAAVWGAIKSFRNRNIAGLSIFVLTFLTFLTLAPIKSSWFLLPIHPIIAVIAGLFINNIYKKYKPSCPFLYFFVLFFTFSLSIFQLIHYRHDYIVPDTTNNQAAISRLAGAMADKGQAIYLDDEYLPVAVFYSRKKVIPLRFSRTANPVPSLTNIPEGSVILTNAETFPVLKSATGILFEELFSAGGLFLIRAKGIRA